MRKIGQLSNKTDFETFCYYLYSLGIETHISDDEKDYSIWVIKDSHLKTAQYHLVEFQKNPQKESFKEKAKEGMVKEKADHKKAAEKAKKEKFIDARLELFTQNSFAYTSFSFALIAISVLLFVIKFSSQNNNIYYWLSFSEDHWGNYLGIKSFAEILNGQIWRLITPIFLHHDMLHLLFNMYWLFKLATQVEKELGKITFLFFIIFVAISSNTAFYLVAGPRFGGMSGIIYGLIAYIWMQDIFYARSSHYQDSSLYKFFTFWYVLCWILTIIGLFRVANTVHGIGALSGMIFSLAVSFYKHPKQTLHILKVNRENLQSLIILCLLIFGGMFTDYLSYYR